MAVQVEAAMLAERRCAECAGLEQCGELTTGVRPIITEMGGMLYAGCEPCRYEFARREQRRISAMMKNASVPSKFANATFENYQVTEERKRIVAAAKAIASGKERRGLMLHSASPGTGKTRLAATIVNERIRRGLPAVFVVFGELLDAIKRSFDSGKAERILEMAKESPFLVLDDLGAERPTAWAVEQIYTIINARMSAELQTVITTNYSLGRLAERLAHRDKSGKIEDDIPGKRIVSRLAEMCFVVEMQGEDWRTKCQK